MLPLELFGSHQFASATVLALVTYAALGGVIFLFVAFLQISLAHTVLGHQVSGGGAIGA